MFIDACLKKKEEIERLPCRDDQEMEEQVAELDRLDDVIELTVPRSIEEARPQLEYFLRVIDRGEYTFETMPRFRVFLEHAFRLYAASQGEGTAS